MQSRVMATVRGEHVNVFRDAAAVLRPVWIGVAVLVLVAMGVGLHDHSVKQAERREAGAALIENVAEFDRAVQATASKVDDFVSDPFAREVELLEADARGMAEFLVACL